MATGGSRSHETLARIGDAGHTGVAHHGDPLSGGHAIEQLRDESGLGVVVQHQELRGTYPDVGEQAAGATGVLTGHDISRGQCLDRPRGEVAQVSDGCADEDDRAGAHRASS